MENFLQKIGFPTIPKLHHNLAPAALIERSLQTEQTQLADNGALVVNTGAYTGRSAKDKYVVDTEAVHDEVAWNTHNQPISQELYTTLRTKVLKYLADDELFIFDGFAGAAPRFQQKVRVINELASQNLFMHNLLIRPTPEELADFGTPDITIISAPNYRCNPLLDGTSGEVAIMLNIEAREVIICGTHYSGEMKKSVFVLMNYLLPKQNVLPMHCSANIGKSGDVAIFFGLSGTGKTTLSTDPHRFLLGDDEHGWSDEGVFNIEGGLYAKCMDLTKESEPEIFQAIRFGALVENVVLNQNTRVFDYADASLAENSRVGFPMEFIEGARMPSIAGHPNVIIFLTADAFGVLPPIAKLTNEQAKYHFISGYTSKVSGTEIGITEPTTTFSTCFGAPFLPLPAITYAEMLGDKLDNSDTDVYLINTGWSGGAYGVGKRMPLKLTRSIVSAALDGSLKDSAYIQDPIFQFMIPTSCPEVDATVLNPRNTWQDPKAYDLAAEELANKFITNFTKYDQMSEAIIQAGPRVK